MQQPISRHAVGPNDGEIITDRPGRTVRILVSGDEAITMTWSRFAVGEHGPDLHVHHEHTDAFYVVRGTMTYIFGTDDARRELTAGAGSVLVAPPDVPHSFWNAGPDEAVFLNIHTPDTSFAHYLRTRRDQIDWDGFDQFPPPPTGNRPGSDAIVVAPGAGEPGPDPATLVRYVGEDLVVTEEPDSLTISIPSSPGPDVVYLLGAD
jgi:mannose-6-phosphate isomerase-like protein (cupin superfamily)